MKYSWSNISLENYAAIDALNRGAKTTENKVSMLSLASGKPESYFEGLDFVELYSEIKDLNEFLDTEIQEKLYPVFWCSGRRFKLTCLTQEEIKGKHVEALSLLKITSENVAENCPKILAALTEETFSFRKKLSFQQKVDAFNTNLPSSVGMGVCLFFWEVLNELQPVILNYLNSQVKNLHQKMSQ